MKAKTHAIVAAGAALLLSACIARPAAPKAAPAQQPASPAASIENTSWTLATLDGQPALADTTVTLNFEAAGRAGGSDGCNNYSGSYTVNGSQLAFGQLVSTMMACPEPIMKQATAYAKALSQTAAYKSDGAALTLLDAGGKDLATFTRQNTGLPGTSWKATSINNGKQAVVSVLEGSTLTLLFDPEGAAGAVAGSGGCNNFSGTYQTDGQALTLGPLASTLMACEEPAGIMEQEMQYLAALETAATYRIDGDRMEMRTKDDALAAMFVRQP
jgi:heat shock protein HslJ